MAKTITVSRTFVRDLVEQGLNYDRILSNYRVIVSYLGLKESARRMGTSIYNALRWYQRKGHPEGNNMARMIRFATNRKLISTARCYVKSVHPNYTSSWQSW